jgi:hypothetical protein
MIDFVHRVLVSFVEKTGRFRWWAYGVCFYSRLGPFEALMF